MSADSSTPGPLQISSEEYDRIYQKTKMKVQMPEIDEDPNLGSVRERTLRLKTEQATMLRTKHVPAKMHDALLAHKLKDTSRGKPVGFEHNVGRTIKPMKPSEDAKLSAAHHISSKQYDEIYKETKMTAKSPEVVTSNNPGGVTMRRKNNEPFTFEERMEKLKSQQGDELRKKHIPDRLKPHFEEGKLKDTSRGVDVGFEYNFKNAGGKMPMQSGAPCKALEKSSLTYDKVYEETREMPKDPEIHKSHIGSMPDRFSSLRVNQGRSLRQRHLPERLQNISIKDLPGQRNVGFEWNMLGPEARSH